MRLPYPKQSGLKHIKEYTLPQNFYVGQWIVPAGTVVKLVSTKDHGVLALPPQCQDGRGFTIPQRLFLDA